VKDWKSFSPSKRRAAGHGRGVEPVFHPPHERLGQGRPPSRDLVEVAASDRRVAGMEAPRRGLQGEQVDVGGQLLVDAPEELGGGEPCLEVEVRDLVQRVHARVGAAGAVELAGLAAGDGLDRAVQLARHRTRVLLDLPSAVARAHVFESDLEARHL